MIKIKSIMNENDEVAIKTKLKDGTMTEMFSIMCKLFDTIQEEEDISRTKLYTMLKQFDKECWQTKNVLEQK